MPYSAAQEFLYIEEKGIDMGIYGSAGASATSLSRLSLAMAVLTTTLWSVSVCAQQPFVALGGNSSLSYINNLGQAVGVRAESNGTKSIITFNGATQVIDSGDSVIDINDQGGIIYTTHFGFLYREASGTSVEAGYAGVSYIPVAVNNNGLFAGNYYGGGHGIWDAYAYTNPLSGCSTLQGLKASLTQLPNWRRWEPEIAYVEGYGTYSITCSYAYALNDSGTVAGYCTWWPQETDPHETYRRVASYWTGTTVHKMGTLGYNSSEATAINNIGDIAGALFNSNGSIAHAFLYSNDTMQVLTDFYVKPIAINDLGVILSANSFYCDGIVTPIQSLLPDGWTLGAASDINNLDQIVGYATGPDGLQHGFILQVPEPTTMCLMGLGLMALLRHRRARTRG